MVICLDRGADCLLMVRLMPLSMPSQNPIISWLTQLRSDFTFFVPPYLGCLQKEAVKLMFCFFR